MLKTMKSGVIWNYPLDKKSDIKCEGCRGFYTIIDAVTYKNQVYVLLEHNTYGDEAPYNLAVLPRTCLRWYVVEKRNGEEKDYFFIRDIDILGETYDPIDVAMHDYCFGIVNDDEIEFWTDEEIDNMEVI